MPGMIRIPHIVSVSVLLPTKERNLLQMLRQHVFPDSPVLMFKQFIKYVNQFLYVGLGTWVAGPHNLQFLTPCRGI